MPTDTQVNDLKINVLSEAQYEQIASPSATELYLVPEVVDTTPTSGSTNPITSGGVYNALQNIPSQEQSDWNETNTTDPAYIKNKPTIPAAQVNSDWNASSGVAQILNKPNLATVATSGSYDDLSNTPDLSSYVSGPSVATEDNITVYDGTTGKLVKDADISVVRLFEDVEYLDNTKSNPYYIARTTGKWAGSTSNAHRILDLTNIRKVTITARSNRDAQYTFLKSYTEPDSEDVGETPDYANGYTTAVQIDAGTTQSLTVPADANYLYILVSTSYTYTPASLKITGIGITEHSGTGSGFVKDDGSVDSTSYEPSLPSKTSNEGKVLAVNSGATGYEWIRPVKIYSGATAPTSSTGTDGDIYIQTTA